MEKGKIKFDDDDLTIVPDDIFRKIRRGREHKPQSKVQKKPLPEMNTLNIVQHNVLSWQNRHLELVNIYRSLDPHLINFNKWPRP